METSLTRRRFFQALAASALAASVPLPIGFPTAPLRLAGWYGYDHTAILGKYVIRITGYDPLTSAITIEWARDA